MKALRSVAKYAAMISVNNKWFIRFLDKQVS